VGAHLLNHLTGIPYSVYYWRHRGFEIDFIVKTPKKLWGIEVKSGRPKHPKGVSEFLKSYPDAKILIIGSQGMSLEEFFRTDPRAIF